MDTAQGITKFLRSKLATDKIVPVAFDLLNGQLPTYLPDKTFFIYELACDRLNDTSSKFFQHWKLDPEVWRLLLASWRQLPAESVPKMSRKLKLVDVLVAVFQSGKCTTPLLDIVFEFTQCLVSKSYVDIDESHSITLLGAYLQAAKTLEQVLDEWTFTIQTLYLLPKQHILYRASKKNYAKFFEDALPEALKFIENGDTTSVSLVRKILVQQLFEEELRSQLKSNIDSGISTKDTKYTESTVEILFKMVIENIAARDIKLCEDIFICIIQSQNFSLMSENLLRTLAKVNRALSYDFFLSIYETEMKASPPNWRLISYIVLLDSQIALKFKEDIFNNVKSLEDDEVRIRLGTSMAAAHLKARELDAFFTRVWPSAIKQDSFWSSDKFIDTMSAKVDDLTSKQLQSVFSTLTANKDDLDQNLPMITAIVKGLQQCPSSKVNDLKEQIVSFKPFFADKNDGMWRLRYYIMVLYKGDAFGEHEQKLTKLLSSSVSSDFYYYCVFRSLELEKLNDFDKKKLVKYIKKSSDGFLESILKRWFIIVSTNFSDDQLAEIIAIVLESLDWKKVISFFQDEAGYFFEQTKISKALVDHLMVQIEKKHSKYLDLVPLVPVPVISKHVRQSLIDAVNNYTSSKDISINCKSRVAIKHLLTQYSSGSSLEKKFKKLLSLVETSCPAAMEDSKDIVRHIWKLHSVVSKESEKYTSKVSDELCAFFAAKSSNGKIAAQHHIAYIILSDSHGPGQSRLLKVFTTAVGNQLLTASEPEELTWCACALLDTYHEESQSDISKFVKTAGAKVDQESTQDVKDSIFRLVCRVSDVSKKSVLFVLSVYVLLYPSSIDEISQRALSKYLDRVSDDVELFESLVEFVADSYAKDLDTNNCLVLSDILCLLLRKLKKANDNSKKLFVKLLSLFVTKASVIKTSPALKRILVDLKMSLSDRIWIFSQYSTELTLAFVNSITEGLDVEEFVLATQVFSHLLLFHRFRLSSRHHLIIAVLSTMLEQLSLKNHQTSVMGGTYKSEPAARAYARLLANLCEPPSSHRGEDKLTSSAAVAKNSLRPHLHVLVANYVYLQLKYNFESKVNTELMAGVFSMLNVLSPKELQLVSLSLDFSGKTYFRTLYANYKDHGKWKE